MTVIKRLLVAGALFGAFAFTAASAQTPSTLEAVKKRGQLICGVNVGLGGFSLPDSQGKWAGLDVDMCNAVAAAVLAMRPRPSTCRCRPSSASSPCSRARSTCWCATRPSRSSAMPGSACSIAGVNFYDGQGFMVSKKLGVKGVRRAQRRHDLRRPGHDP